MPKDGTLPAARKPEPGSRSTARRHPSWCDPGECTIGTQFLHRHQSASQVVKSDALSETVIEAHLTRCPLDVTPYTWLELEISPGFGETEDDDAAEVYTLSLAQACRLLESLTRLVSAALAPAS